jgi:hypothetical protein
VPVINMETITHPARNWRTCWLCRSTSAAATCAARSTC